MTLNAKQKKALKTKKRILETALELFSQKGYNQVTVDEIVEKSKTSKGAFYGHFASKSEIFLEKFKEIDNFYDEFCKTLPNDLSAKEKIIRLSITQMKYLKNDLGKELMQTIYMNPQSAKFLADTNRRLYHILENYLQEGQEKGEFTKDFSIQDLAMIISRCMRGTLYDWFIFEKELDPVIEIEKMLQAVFQGIEKC
ncbi:helix-turn-helix domain-containing protein [Aeribacillus sp. FSL k6-2211]|uniref:TetR/AcrR family transcriptional regulator n=1 Tax=Aeribacillus sp. FSL k6-2211 TaxID=2954608 RepID=UPI0030D2246C